MSWKAIKVGDFGKVITGNTPPKNRLEFYGDAYKFIKPTDMEIGMRYTPTTEECYSLEGFKKYEKSVIPPLSTCVVTIGSIGKKITLSDDYCFVNQAVNAVIPNLEKYDPYFVFYALRNILNKVKSADTGASSGRENVSKSNFSGLTLDVPECLDTQQKIASILSAYDDLIENNLKRIRLLEEAAQHLYREWFVRFRFPGWEEVEVVDGLPVGWERKTVKEAIQISPATKIIDDKPAPFVPMTALSENSMVISGIEERVPKGGARFINRDTLFARITPCLENGKTGFVQFMEDENQVATGSTEFIVLRETADVGAYFIYCLARHYDFREHAIKSMSGSDGRQRVKPDAFEKYYLCIPPKALKEEFERIVEPFFKAIQVLANQNQKLKAARDILLPRLMNQTIEV